VTRRPQGGQALVEFAFVFPIIALLAFAFVDIGRAVFNYNTLTNAARQAARVAIVNQVDPASAPWDCAANKPVQSAVTPTWTFRGCAVAAGAAIGVTPADVDRDYGEPFPGSGLVCDPAIRLDVGCIVTITVVNEYVAITPIAGSLIGPMTMTGTSSMPIERLFP
jgi:hypothetical protein